MKTKSKNQPAWWIKVQWGDYKKEPKRDGEGRVVWDEVLGPYKTRLEADTHLIEFFEKRKQISTFQLSLEEND